MTANPTLLSMPLAQNGQKNEIPKTQATAGDGLFSQSTGFPAETSLPLGAGGVAPSREDFNGMANLLGGVAFYAQKGWQFQFDAGQDYFAGCIVRDTTDGKLYECLNDVTAGGSVPSADAANWKESGVDPSMFANPDLSNLSATGENHFLEQDFSVIYPNDGTEVNPATVVNNTKYIEANPFPGYEVQCLAEAKYNDKWISATWASNAGSGTYANGISARLDVNTGNIVVSTATTSILPNTAGTPALFDCSVPSADIPSSPVTSAPCRVKVWKIGKVASE